MIELDTLLKPISEDNPSGQDLREDASPTSVYYTIKDERIQASNQERKKLHGDATACANAHWKYILEHAPKILSAQSKDFEIAAWYTEALLRQYGFKGLTLGFQLLNQFVLRYWEIAFPEKDEEGYEFRLAALASLNGLDSEGTLILPIRQQYLTDSTDQGGPYAFWEYHRALNQPKAKPSVEDILQAAHLTSKAYYAALLSDLEKCIEALKELRSTLDDVCAQEAPPLSGILENLQAFKEHVYFLVADAPFNLDQQESTGTSSNKELATPSSQDKLPVEDSAVMPSRSVKAGGIQSRIQALNQLEEIAEFFSKTEPHSLLPFVIRRAVSWGKLPLPELLKEIIKDNNALSNVCQLTGIENEKSTSNVQASSTSEQALAESARYK